MSKNDKQTQTFLVYADELVETLRTQVPRAVKEFDGKAIHQSRVATRRLTAAADVFKPISGRMHRRELNRVLKKLRKKLGSLRDLDVMLTHLTELNVPAIQSGTDFVRSCLLEKQRTSQKDVADDVDVAKVMARLGSWWGVREEWCEAGDGLHLLLAESLHLQLDQFIEHADAIAGLESKANQALLDPHALRIAGKALRYTLELAVAGGHPLPAAITGSFKRMQDALGLWHDYVVLNDQVLELIIGNRDAKIVLSVLAMARETIRRSQRQLEAFNRLWKEKGNSIAAAIRLAFPLTSPVDAIEISNEQTDHDRAGSEGPPEDLQETVPGESSAG